MVKVCIDTRVLYKPNREAEQVGRGRVAAYKGGRKRDTALSLVARILPGSGRARMWP